MPTAIWNRIVIAYAPTDAVEIIEGNVYFPPQAVRMEYLRPSEHVTECHWKGKAHYFDVLVANVANRNAAWTYPEPLKAASHIANYIAFWRGVTVEL